MASSLESLASAIPTQTPFLASLTFLPVKCQVGLRALPQADTGGPALELASPGPLDSKMQLCVSDQRLPLHSRSQCGLRVRKFIIVTMVL